MGAPWSIRLPENGGSLEACEVIHTASHHNTAELIYNFAVMHEMYE